MHAWPKSTDSRPSFRLGDDGEENGRPKPDHNTLGSFLNGHARTASEARRIRDAEAFELQGLISEEEGDELDNVPPLGSMDPRKADDEESEPVAWKVDGQGQHQH